MLPSNIHDTVIKALAIAAVRATQNVTDGDEQTRQLIEIKEARDYLKQLQAQPRWEPVTNNADLIEFLEQGALVEVDGNKLHVYRNGEGATVELPEHLALCLAHPQQQAQPRWEPITDESMIRTIEIVTDGLDEYEGCRLCRLVQPQQPQEDSSHE
jgi:hypothetical protein